MTYRLLMVFAILGTLAAPATAGVHPHSAPLDSSWLFRNAAGADWLPATIPGCVHTDLMQAGVIPDPFHGTNEDSVQWVGEADWIYRTDFTVNAGQAAARRIELRFEGLDTHARVLLNGTEILQADNMFRTWRVDVKDLVRRDANELEIHFTSPLAYNAARADSLPHTLPDDRVFTRKAPYQFGWDWGPTLATVGIWRPVYLDVWDDVRIGAVQIIQDDLDDKVATLRARVTLEAAAILKRDLRLVHRGMEIVVQSVQLDPGVQTMDLPLVIVDPQRWWTHDLGEPFLETVRLELLDDGKVIDAKEKTFGLRTIELVQTPDEEGSSFHFRLNGHDIFIRGANWIPLDSFPHRVTRDDYRRRLQDAVDVNMNMLRVWGGGIYESDDFYALSDSLGLLVWQDFMFACAMYPGDEAFLANVAVEAEQQITRLRDHPSIALWCGNNEIDEGWHNWGWQQQHGWDDHTANGIWRDYEAVFHELLPEKVAALDPRRDYWPSSPSTGWGRPESLTFGDVHYWGVWWGAEPFEVYREKVGRFNSEYGFQGLPAPASLAEFLPTDQLRLDSPGLTTHQKHPRGAELIATYMARDFPVPDDFADYVYISQLVQAHGIGLAVEAHRRDKPRCMGTLYWQLNDCWPVVSWSSVDWYGRWKLLHHALQEAYAPVLVSPVQEGDTVAVWMVSDATELLTGEMAWRLMDFEGQVLREGEVAIQIDDTAAKKVWSADVPSLLDSADPRSCVLVLNASLADSSVRGLHYFARPKDLQLPAAAPVQAVEPTADGFLLTLTADRLIKNVGLYLPGAATIPVNGFDLLPGETRVIRIRSDFEEREFRERLAIRSLNQFIAP